ncbi:MAG TPA: carboxypeptidase-like regulatory domain-containing protein [Candidatus Binataceae bacterium]
MAGRGRPIYTEGQDRKFKTEIPVQTMKPTLWLVLTLALIIAGCIAPPAGAIDRVSDVQSTGVLEGTVNRGPLLPVQRPGDPSAAPVPGARINIATTDGKPVTAAETDSAGSFRITLPAGTYRVTMMPSAHGPMIGRNLPATITIGPGERRHLNIQVDSGMR